MKGGILTMDILSTGSYPANKLSNFAGHQFVIDGILCRSMEGFLQALKHKDIPSQEYTCGLVGRAAKRKGSNKTWNKHLYWQGREIERESEEYTELISRAFDAMFEQSDSFQRALQAAKDSGANLTHSIGKRNKKDTVLTRTEFIGQLDRLMDRLPN